MTWFLIKKLLFYFGCILWILWYNVESKRKESAMKIVGLQKLTLLDYPGRVACTVFLDGCNFRCPFCHNAELLEADTEPVMDTDQLLAFLNKRQGILDGVCITGGEPTIHPELPELLRSIRTLGYTIKLDTNGYRPQVLKQLIQESLVDYVAMDLKNGPDAYGETVGLASPDPSRIEESVQILMDSGVDYELRTTVAEPLHTEKSISEMAAWLRDLGQGRAIKRLYLQPFVDRDTVPVSGLCAPDPEKLRTFQRLLEPCSEKISVRGT